EMNTRKSLKSMLPLLLTVLLSALLLAGCGGKDKAASTADEPAAPPATAAAVSEVKGDPAAGQVTFQTACVACHGPDATGVPNLGKSLHDGDSEFVRTQSDEAL